jgi:hypothetical protein
MFPVLRLLELCDDPTGISCENHHADRSQKTEEKDVRYWTIGDLEDTNIMSGHSFPSETK